MARSRAVPALLVAVLSFLAALPARAAYDSFRTSIRFSKAVQLADGSVLPAGVHEFQINFAGAGKTAEFEFILPNGKHVKHAAEAVGFMAHGSGGGEGRVQKVEYKYYEWVKIAGEKPLGDYKEVKLAPHDPMKYKEFEGELRDAHKTGLPYLKLKQILPPGPASPESFSFGRSGFGANTQPTAKEETGLIIVVCRSSNSPAFFRGQFMVANPARSK